MKTSLFPKNILTAIEISESHLKVFQAKASGKQRLISFCESRAFHQDSDEEIVRALIEMTRLRSVAKEHLFVSIPRRFAILKQMRLPSSQETELKKMIALQLINQIPYVMEDVVYDYQLLDKDASGYSRVLVIVLPKDVCKRYLKIMDKAGLSYGRLVLSSTGISQWFSSLAAGKYPQSEKPLALINLDLMHAEICFYHQGLLFSRHVNWGIKDLIGDEGASLIHQIDLSLGTYRKENMGPAIERIVLISSLEEAKIFKDRLGKECQLPVDIIDPWTDLPVVKNLDLSFFKKQKGVSPVVALGALSLDIKKIPNLTPQEVNDTKQERHRRKQWVQFMVLFVLIFLAAASLFVMEIFQRNQVLEQSREQLRQVEKKVKQAQQRINFVKFFNDEFHQRLFVADVLQTLFSLTPSEISFRSLVIDDKGLLTIQGYGKTGGSVNIFQNNLLHSPLFKQVNLQFATKRKIFNLDLTDFKITAQLGKNKGE